MNLWKIIYGSVIVLTLAACGTSGPIKAYDESAVLDKASLSVIYLPPQIDLLEVDGVKKESPFIEEGLNEIHILAGRHQIAVRYMAYWGDGTLGNIVTSKPVVLSLDIAPKSAYYFKFKQPKDSWQAGTMARNFSPWVEDGSGKKLKIAKIVSGGSTLTRASGTAGSYKPPAGTSALENLKYWWKQAGFKEKKSFEKWMNEN